MKGIIDWARVQYDLQYIILNRVINQIPCWTIRRFLYRRYGMNLESGARIGIGTVILNPRNIYIGKRSVINENCYLDGRGKLEIGHDTSISAYVKILSASHNMKSKSFAYFENKTVIGNYVWIGTGAVILDGSRVKHYAVIGAGAVFKGITGERQIFIGNPCRYIKDRELKERYCLEYKAYFR